MIQYSYARYLRSKRTVDDRALNKDVVGRLRQELAHRPTPTRVIEVGCGIGTMPARLVEWGILEQADYTLLDVDGDSLEQARGWLLSWAQTGGRTFEALADGLRIGTGAGSTGLTIRFVQAELADFLGSRSGVQHDLLIANAVLDLVDVESLLPRLMELLGPGGRYWFTINFDADTIFEPAHPLDDALLAAYHGTMDSRIRYGRAAGHSKTGRRLFAQLNRVLAPPLAAGASDWIVYATRGAYEADEAYFLHHIIDTIDGALRQVQGVAATDLASWVATRHAQIERGELVYIAHQLDFLGAAPRVTGER